jgi:serine/threonine protein kinase
MVQKELDMDGKRILNGYVFVGDIGSGAYGKVRLAYERDNQDQKYAVKCVPRSGGLLGRRLGGMGAQNQQQQQRFTKEVAIMKAIRHKNIVTLHAVVDDPEDDKVYMVMDYIDGGNLLEEEKSPSKRADGFIYKPLPEVLAVKYMRQLVGGLRYLHKHRIAHRDIKPMNILLRKSDDTVFIADFGTAELGTYLTTMEDLNSTFSASVERSVLGDEPPPGTPAAALMITEIENGGGHRGSYGGPSTNPTTILLQQLPSNTNPTTSDNRIGRSVVVVAHWLCMDRRVHPCFGLLSCSERRTGSTSSTVKRKIHGH